MWSLGGVQIYVDEYSGVQPAVIGELHVLDSSTSTKHYSGSNGLSARIGGMLFDTDGTKLDTLLSFTESSTARTLISDQGNEGDFYVKSVDWKRVQAVNKAYPVYKLTIELLEA